jgi:ubiquinone/menaquinone biosynthesis C-methylase UbiE
LDDAFDVVPCSATIVASSDARRALAEMVRVTHQSGRIAVLDFDWDTLIVDHPDKGLNAACHFAA